MGTREMVEEMQATVNAQPTSAVAYFNLGVALDEDGQLEAALDAYQRAIDLSPEQSLKAHYNRALGLMQLNRFAEAREHLQDFCALDSSYPPAWFMLGNACGVLNDVDAGISATQRGLSIAPKDPMGWANLAKMLTCKDELADAIEAYKSAIEHQHDFMAAYLALGTLYAWQQAPDLRDQIPLLPDSFHMHLRNAEDGLRFTLALVCLGQMNEVTQSMVPLREARPDYAEIVERIIRER